MTMHGVQHNLQSFALSFALLFEELLMAVDADAFVLGHLLGLKLRLDVSKRTPATISRYQ